jgi:hypothetical protein
MSPSKLLEAEGDVGYRRGEKGAELETMGYLEFLARATSDIPDKGQVMMRYSGLFASAHRGKVRTASLAPSPLRIDEEKPPPRAWAFRELDIVADPPVGYFP